LQRIKTNSTAVVVVAYNSENTIANCLRSLDKTFGPNDEAFVIDNASTDRTVAVIDELKPALSPRIHFLPQSKNHGFSRGCNIGIAASSSEFVILLNPDTEVFEDWIERMTTHFRLYPKTGAVGALSNNCLASQNVTSYMDDYSGRQWRSDELLSELRGRFGRRSLPASLLMGFCLALRRDLINELGPLDQDIFLGDDDLELSWRLRESGYFLRLALDVFVNHVGHASFDTIGEKESARLIKQGSDVLFEKMQNFYGEGNIPHPEVFFNIGWWAPTILKTKNEDELFKRDLLPCQMDEILPNARKLVSERSFDAAAALLEAALKIRPANYQMWFTLGAIFFSSKEYGLAELPLKNAWALQLTSEKIRQKLESLLRILGKDEEIDLLFEQPMFV